MEIKRDRYLNKLISFMRDGQVKVVAVIVEKCQNKNKLIGINVKNIQKQVGKMT